MLQIVLGPGGMVETAQWRDQKERLAGRLTALEAENQRLTARFEALRTSREEVRLEARSLGWFLSGEVPLKTLDGARLRLPSEEPDFSRVPSLPDQPVIPPLFFRLAWPLLFGLFYVMFVLAERLWPQNNRPLPPMVLPRWTLPQVRESGLDFFRK